MKTVSIAVADVRYADLALRKCALIFAIER